MCHHYRIVEAEALGQAAEELEEEPARAEAEPKPEGEATEPPVPTADD